MNNRQPKFNEEEFLAFAKDYLSEAFPNPERTGCPSFADLTRMAEKPMGADPASSDHLACCSRLDHMEIGGPETKDQYSSNPAIAGQA
jgi:hypothetical protein